MFEPGIPLHAGDMLLNMITQRAPGHAAGVALLPYSTTAGFMQTFLLRLVPFAHGFIFAAHYFAWPDARQRYRRLSHAHIAALGEAAYR